MHASTQWKVKEEKHQLVNTAHCCGVTSSMYMCMTLSSVACVARDIIVIMAVCEFFFLYCSLFVDLLLSYRAEHHWCGAKQCLRTHGAQRPTRVHSIH